MRQAQLVVEQSEVVLPAGRGPRAAVIVAATGELDRTTARSLRGALASAVDDTQQGQLLVLDLRGVVASDSAGLSVAVMGLRVASDKGRRTAMVVTDARLLRRCAVTGVDRYVCVCTSMAAASGAATASQPL